MEWVLKPFFPSPKGKESTHYKTTKPQTSTNPSTQLPMEDDDV